MSKNKTVDKGMYRLWRMIYEEASTGEVNVRWPAIIGLSVGVFLFVIVPLLMISAGQAAPVADMVLMLARLFWMFSGPILLVFALVAWFGRSIKVRPVVLTGLVCCGLGWLALALTSGLHFS